MLLAVYYEKTGRLLKELGDIDNSFGSAQARPRGHLRIDCGGSTATLLLIPALPHFLQRYPDIQIDLGVSDRHVDLVSDNVDCVIRGGVLTDMSMIGRQVGAAGWVTCATPAYLEQHGVPKQPDDLAAGLCGLGLIQTFAYTARAHIASGALVPVLADWQPAPYPFYVVYPPNRHLSNRLRLFIDWIADRFADAAR